MLRTFAGLHQYLYSVSDEGLWVHHYAGSRFDGTLADGTPVVLTQQTDYPWDGRVRLTIQTPGPKDFALMVRIPAWAEGATLGSATGVEPGTYVPLVRTWHPGHEIELVLPMKPALMEAHPRIVDAQGCVAVMRGPLLYCLESPDLPEGVHVNEVRLRRDIDLIARHDPDLLGGVTVLEGEARRAVVDDWAGIPYRPMAEPTLEPIALRLVPYYAWANRGMSEMTVWLPLC